MITLSQSEVYNCHWHKAYANDRMIESWHHWTGRELGGGVGGGSLFLSIYIFFNVVRHPESFI